MGARDESVALLREGFTPAEISKRRKVSLTTTLPYLDEMVGRGVIQRADIYFSIPQERRAMILTLLDEGVDPKSVAATAKQRGVQVVPGDVVVVCKYGTAGHAMGDMYEILREIEIGIHRLLRAELGKVYKDDEEQWWKKGVSKTIRDRGFNAHRTRRYGLRTESVNEEVGV